MNYLQRYLNGEREQVWNELIALGDQVREEPIYSDAKAVARETMTRARKNIELLYERLRAVGYQFDADAKPSEENPLQNLLGSLDTQRKNDPLINSIFGSIFNNMQNAFSQLEHLSLSQPSSPPIEYKPYMPPMPDITQKLDEFEAKVGNLPLSLRAWCELVGQVDFIGEHPGLAEKSSSGSGDIPAFDIRGMMRQMLASNPHLMDMMSTDETEFETHLKNYYTAAPFPISSMTGILQMLKEEAPLAGQLPVPVYQQCLVADPLCFVFDISADETLETLADEDYRAWVLDVLNDTSDEEIDEDAYLPYILTVSPDSLHKADYSGDTYDIRLPNAAADLKIEGTDLYFVAYLRESFKWGGFPGLADFSDYDKELVASLAEGLQPI
jgi:hypothetical protein